eukprot:1145536-Pelagomonas_calceolata.AAC.1
MAAGARWCGSKTKLGSDDEDDEEGGADQRSFCSALVPIKVGMGQPSRPHPLQYSSVDGNYYGTDGNGRKLLRYGALVKREEGDSKEE